MPELSVWVITLATAVLGVGLVVARAMRVRSGAGGPVRAPAGSVDITCTSCNKPLVIHRSDLVTLSRPETALSVRIKPGLVGRKLAEYVCPYCEASHCFAVDGRTPEWVGVNLYSPHKAAARCMDCGKALRTPPWPPGAYDGHLQDAPNLQPDYGLICSKCHAVVCVACTMLATRNRTKDGSYVCPRCTRSPVDRTYHPA